jgi:hypothetical protein
MPSIYGDQPDFLVALNCSQQVFIAEMERLALTLVALAQN